MVNPYYSIWSWYGGIFYNSSGQSEVCPYVMNKWCSDLKNVEPGEKGLRFLGAFPTYGPSQAGRVSQDLLKINFNATEGFGPNSYASNTYDSYIEPLINRGCEVVYMYGDRTWFMPVVAQRSGAIPATNVYGPLIKTLSHDYGMNPYGFTATTTDIVVSSTQHDYKTKTVINFVRGGALGKASYYVERYLSNLIEYNLTCHLPDSFGREEIPYFTHRGKWAGETYFGLSSSIAGDDYSVNSDEQRGCLGPVSYPAAQEPDSPWLWFVSEDEEDNFWLNRLKLGYAGRAIARAKNDSPPIQMEVIGSKVIMVYKKKIVVWDDSNAGFTTWSCGGSIPDYDLTSVAVDRFTDHWWFGHAAGVFLFNEGTVSGINTSGWFGASCAPQGLSVSNGYVAWAPYEYLDSKSEYANMRKSYACWWDSNAGKGRAVQYNEICTGYDPDAYFAASSYAGSGERFIGRVAVRSNGEMIVTHSPNEVWNTYNNDALSMSVIRFDSDLNVSVTSTLQFWTHVRMSMGRVGYDFYMMPLKVVNDCKVIGGIAVMPNLVIMGSSSYQHATAMSNGVTSKTMIIEVAIDDTNKRIHCHHDSETANVHTPSLPIVSGSPTGMMFDRVNYPGVRMAAVDFLASQMRSDKVIHAVHSLCVIQLKKTFAILFCGRQDLAAGGMPLSWSGSDWIAPVAGKPIQTRKADATSHVVDSDTSITFSNNATFAGQSAYGFVCQPSTSDSADISLYFGDFVEKTESVKILAVNNALSCRQIESFYAIDLSRIDTLACVINGTSLTYTTGEPNATQFKLVDNGHLTVSSDHIGSIATVSYNYVAQGS